MKWAASQGVIRPNPAKYSMAALLFASTRFTDTKNYFVSKASVYRLLKEHDLIASPAYIVMKAADEFKDKTTHQTNFGSGWGWFYLSTILDDFSRYIIAWKLCTTMKVGDVRPTLDLALQAAGLDQVHVVHRPRLLSDNGPLHLSRPRRMAGQPQYGSHARRALPPANAGQDRALASDAQEPHLAGKLLSAWRPGNQDRHLRRSLNTIIAVITRP